jgi:hypothetical protein
MNRRSDLKAVVIQARPAAGAARNGLPSGAKCKFFVLAKIGLRAGQA